MKTRNAISVSLAALVAAMGMVSANAADSGWYAGLGLGQSSVDIDGGELDALLAADGITSTTSVDDSDTAWKIFGGYRMNANFGLEAAYMDYGTISADSIVTAPSAGTVGIDLDTTAWLLDAVGYLPLGSGFEVFGKLGVALWDIEGSVSAAGGGSSFSGSADDDGSDFHFGVGASYALTDNIGVRAEWERVNADDDLDAWTVGAQMSF